MNNRTACKQLANAEGLLAYVRNILQRPSLLVDRELPASDACKRIDDYFASVPSVTAAVFESRMTTWKLQGSPDRWNKPANTEPIELTDAELRGLADEYIVPSCFKSLPDILVGFYKMVAGRSATFY